MRLSTFVSIMLVLASSVHAVSASSELEFYGDGLPILTHDEEKSIADSLKDMYKEERNPWYERERFNQQPMIRCSDKLLCSEQDRPLWLARRAFVKAILKVMDKRNITTGYDYIMGNDGRIKFIVNATVPELWEYTSLNSDFTMLVPREVDFRKSYSAVRKLLSAVKQFSKGAVKFHETLCADNKYAGFLLDEESDHWPIGCSWKGSEGIGTCIPVPGSTKVISYVKSDEWVRKLAKFRTLIGCSLDETSVLGNMPELYQCRQRCTDSGIGETQMLILMASIYAILALACTVEHAPAPANN